MGYSPQGQKESDTAEQLFWRRKWPPTPVFLPGEFHEQEEVFFFPHSLLSVKNNKINLCSFVGVGGNNIKRILD